MSDGHVTIGTKIDESGIDKGLKSVDGKLKKADKSWGDTFAGMRDVMQGPVAAGKMLAGVVGEVAKVVGEMTDAYKAQVKAETQLESAAKNNPFLDSSAVQSLKDYASEIQSYTTYGDEELLPLFAKLAAAGRSQDDIMRIMSASVDMAASGAFSLDAAVANLNKSFGGLSGELGESIPEIKSLTAEQLKNGAAVDLLAGRYKGIAKEVAATTGTSEQLANAMGDLKEELGAPFEKGIAPINKFFTSIITGWASAAKAKREAEEGKTSVDPVERLKSEQYALAEIDKQLKAIGSQAKIESDQYGVVSTVLMEQLDALYAKRKEQQRVVDGIQAEIAAQKEANRTKTEAEKNAEIIAQRNREAADYIAKNTADREKSLAALEVQARAEGRAVTAAEKLNVYTQSYVSLITQSNGLVTANNKVAVDLLGTVRAISGEVDAQNLSLEEQAKLEADVGKILGSITAVDNRKESQKMKDQLAMLDEYYKKIQASAYTSADEKLKIEKEYLEKRKILLDQEEQAEKEESEAEIQDKREKAVKMAEIANEFATQYGNIMSTIQQMAAQQIENEATLQNAALEKQYANGEISAEEYESRLTDIKREAAEKKYKIDMWLWGSQLLAAAANTALAITQTLADVTLPTWARIGLTALVSAAGLAQMSAIGANKPLPPAFAVGGVVPGNSYVGDNVIARVNSGERVLTASQNAAFERLAYGGGSGKVQIFNSVSNEVRARPEITPDGVKILIEKTVSQQMEEGRYNRSFKTMQNNIRGTRYTN